MAADDDKLRNLFFFLISRRPSSTSSQQATTDENVVVDVSSFQKEKHTATDKGKEEMKIFGFFVFITNVYSNRIEPCRDRTNVSCGSGSVVRADATCNAIYNFVFEYSRNSSCCAS
jgi:hypothetical protein